jgi:hypothetical protein
LRPNPAKRFLQLGARVRNCVRNSAQQPSPPLHLAGPNSGSSSNNGSNNNSNIRVASGAGSNACPSSPTQDQVKNLKGKTCLDEDKECAAYFICDGCSVTCKNGEWVATGSEVCFSLGATC